MSFLLRLLDLLFPQTNSARYVSECSSEALGALLSPHVTPSGTIALLPYRHPLVRSVILEAKFHQNEKAFTLLAEVVTEYVRAYQEESVPFEPVQVCLVPIPLGKERQKERGYNQIEEIIRRTPFSTTSLLTRTRETVPQTTLSRQARHKNVADAFSSTPLPAHEATYIVIDDVTTTGATLAAAEEALRKQGCSKVVRLALAH